MLVAVGILLVADAECSEQGEIAQLEPQLGDLGERTEAGIERVDLVEGVDLVGEVVFRGKVVLLAERAVEPQPGATEVDRVEEPRREPRLIDRLHRPGAGRIGGGIELHQAPDAEAENGPGFGAGNVFLP